MESVKTIRAVERAFDVLRALQAQPDGATLIELQSATGLSGPTLLRMLKTLIAAGVVRRSMTDQRYRNSVQLQVLAHAIAPADRLADVAAPWLDQLCQQVEWPSDLMVHVGDDDFMMVLESNLRQSRFYVRRRYGRIRVNLMASAAGSAFLSALTPERRMALVRAARSGRDVHNAKAIALNDAQARVEEARRRGYASRHPVYRGGGYNGAARDDSLQAIAVPIIGQGQVLGALNINWNRAAFTEREMVRRHLPALQKAAQGIAADAVANGLLADLPGLERADNWPDGVAP
ncbi:helix-turn-helix domain-containing protein [Variovorax sp. VNK109]|jgi:IclR family mhp operon transcriptional activator|uniref:helix-turn-helix domain-containing protein n=1 Tax=Variovorax sp. VNK109 TaxID=3400919 RepID=UPI003C0BDBBF